MAAHGRSRCAEHGEPHERDRAGRVEPAPARTAFLADAGPMLAMRGAGWRLAPMRAESARRIPGMNADEPGRVPTSTDERGRTRTNADERVRRSAFTRARRPASTCAAAHARWHTGTTCRAESSARACAVCPRTRHTAIRRLSARPARRRARARSRAGAASSSSLLRRSRRVGVAPLQHRPVPAEPIGREVRRADQRAPRVPRRHRIARAFVDLACPSARSAAGFR